MISICCQWYVYFSALSDKWLLTKLIYTDTLYMNIFCLYCQANLDLQQIEIFKIQIGLFNFE